MNEEPLNKKPDEGNKSTSSAPASSDDSRVRAESRVKKIITGFESAFLYMVGKTEEKRSGTGDLGTDLAHQRTDLAIDRSFLAAERTLMGWIRTSLSMISFGFTLGKLGQVLHDVEVKGIFRPDHMISIERISYFLVILGTVALFGACVQHWRRVRELYTMGLHRQISITFIVALLLVLVGMFAFTGLVLAL